MNISISHIAWNLDEDDTVAHLLKKYQVKGIDVSFSQISRCDTATYRDYWIKWGVRIIGVQSLLFQQPKFEMFRDEKIRQETLSYLSACIEMSSRLGAKVLVFGSPQNRRIHSLRPAMATDIAVDFFSRLAVVAERYNMYFCIEPIPQAAGCDFITTAEEAYALVKKVDRRGFRLVLDSAAMMINKEPFEKTIVSCFPYLAHFHMREPDFGSIRNPRQKNVAVILDRLSYKHWVSVEMGMKPGHSPVTSLRKSLDFVSTFFP